MKKVIYIIGGLMFTLNTFGQANEAKQLVDEVSEKLTAYKTVAFDFEHKLENFRTNTFQTNKGKVLMNGVKFRLNYLDIVQIFDGKKIYTISEEDEEVTISKSNNIEEDEMLTPNQILNIYKKGYTITSAQQEKVAGKNIQYVKLTHPKKTNLKYILIGVDINSKNLYNMIHFDTKGTVTTFTIQNLKVNQPISPSKFQFLRLNYKDYYINELN